jgi:SAM-dependent methyltransferase
VAARATTSEIYLATHRFDVLLTSPRPHFSREWWIPQRAGQDELIDSLDQPTDDFRQSFNDLRTINRLFGGISLVLARLSSLVQIRPTETISVLDVGSGSADIPSALLKWGRNRGGRFRVTATDINPTVLAFAQPDPDLELATCDAASLPFAADSFDYVLSSLTFHHFEDDLAVRALREMHRVARRAVVINDLRRAYLPAALIWIVTRALRMNRMTRHDAPLSVLRSRTIDEYRLLIERSGIQADVFRHPFWRVAVVARKAG